MTDIYLLIYLIHAEELCKPLKRVKRKVKRVQLNNNIQSYNTDYGEKSTCLHTKNKPNLNVRIKIQM